MERLQNWEDQMDSDKFGNFRIVILTIDGV